MRPKVVLGMFLAAACVLAVVVLLPKTTHTPPPASAPETPAPAPAPIADLKPLPLPAPAPITATPVIAVVATNMDTNAIALAKEKHEEFVKNRANELMAAAMLDDTASHQVIVQELTNSDRAIRKVALDAVQQTQDRSLIPQMQQIADATPDDDSYKEALEDAIAFMKLPTLTEAMKAQQNGGGNSSPPTDPPGNLPSRHHNNPPTPPPAQGQPQ